LRSGRIIHWICAALVTVAAQSACGQSVDDNPEFRTTRPEPAWVREAKFGPCSPPTEQEAAQFAHVFKTFEVFPERGGWPLIGAVRFLARAHIRGLGVEAQIICSAPTPDGLARRLVDGGHFSGAYVFHDEIGLARFLGPADPEIVDAVARTAFHTARIEGDDASGRDVRPLALTVLAEMGASSAVYGQQAFAAMGSGSELETGAAQVAVATGYPGALERVEQLMSSELARHGEVIPRTASMRLEELGYALAFAGADAQPHLGPVYALLDRRVESWATVFGMVEIAPATICLILERIGGEEAETRRASPPCDSAKLIFPG
jgi:hypothetical protein